MNSGATAKSCPEAERIAIHALRAMPAKAALQLNAHIASCEQCREELERIQQVVNVLIDWPTDDIKPSVATREAVARRISAEIGRDITLPSARWCHEVEWEQVSPGIWCKLLSTDTERQRVSMLVRLAPGAS